MQVCRGVGWTKLLFNEESVRLVLDLLVDVGNGLTNLIYRLQEVFLSHLCRLSLQLFHDCFIDNG